MDNELIFRQAQSCETDRIMQIIRQAQARMHAAGSRQWQGARHWPVRASTSGRTAIPPRDISRQTSAATAAMYCANPAWKARFQ